MTQEVRTPPLQPAAVTSGQAAARPSLMDRVDGALEGLWHLLTSMRVAMILMIALAVLGVIGSLVIQAPVGVLGDDAAKAEWVNTVRPRFGGWTNVMDALQLFQIFNSLVFRVLVAALTISLIACTVHRIPGAWRTATKPRVDVGPAFFEHAPQHEAIVVHATSADTLASVTAVLRKHHYRTLTTDDGTIHLYADRFRWIPFASLAGHVSLVMILAGAIIGSTFGYRDQNFVIAEGNTLPVGAEQGVTLKLVDFSDTYYPTTGEPSDYASQVLLFKDGQQVAAQTIRVNEPMTWNGTTFYQASFGQAAVMTVKDASGNVLYSSGVPLQWQSTQGNRPAGTVAIPGTDQVLDVINTNGTSDTEIQPGQVQAVIYGSDGQAKGMAVLDQGKAAQLGAYTVTFEREAKYSVLNVGRDPGQFLIWLGAFLLFAGFLVVFMLPQRRLWARIAPRGGASVLSVASLGRRDVALGSDFDKLVTDIRTALQAPAQA